MTPNQTGQSKLLKSLLAVIVLMALIAPAVWAQAPVKKQDATAGQALSLLFDSHRAPPAKSMGLLQGNFLDAVDVSGSLQLALVIDVRESIEDQL